MATPLSEVYDYFLTKVNDYTFVELNQTGDLEAYLYKHLRSSVVKFTSSRKSLSIDTNTQVFTNDLDVFELEILASLMVVSYVNGKILNVTNMQPHLSDKEYKTYSQANFLKEMQSLKSNMQSEVSHLMSIYSYNVGLEDILS